MSEKTLAELASLLDAKVVGCNQTVITSALPLQDAQPGCITLVESNQPAERIAQATCAAILVCEERDGVDKPMLLVADLHDAFQRLIRLFRPPRTEHHTGVHTSAVVDTSAAIGQGVSIGAGVTIAAGCRVGERCRIYPGVQILADCVIGDDCIIYPNTVIYEDTRIGSRAVIHAGVVIGSFGFGFKEKDGVHERAAQMGWVEIGDDVEIGSNSSIDRGTYGATRIGDGTKLDNLVQVGHNAHIGQHNLICAQVGIAGSSTTGDYVVLAGQVGLADHVRLGDRAVVGAQSGVMRDVEPDDVVFGSPAMQRKVAMQRFASQAKIPEMRREIRKLQQELSSIKALHADSVSPASDTKAA